MTANYVARETGYAMHGWGHGDRATNEAFAPDRDLRGALRRAARDIEALGFDTVDIWGAHLSPDWATDAHVDAAPRRSSGTGCASTTYATWVGPSNVERSCELTRALGAAIIGGGFSGEPEALAPTLAAVRGAARDREPSGEDARRSCSRRSQRGDGMFGRDGRHGLVGDAGLRRRAGDRGARRARAPRPPEGRAGARRAARDVPLGRGDRPDRGVRARRCSGSATRARSPSSTSPRRSTRPTTSARCASSSRGGSRERRDRRRREHRRRATPSGSPQVDGSTLVGATDIVPGARARARRARTAAAPTPRSTSCSPTPASRRSSTSRSRRRTPR